VSALRTGIGFDIHRLVEGRKLFLGGVLIDYERGLVGHSDGDVLLHALCDALLGAAGLGDIGDHFPDTSPRWKDVRSTEILAQVRAMLSRQGLAASGVDCIIFAEQPRLEQLKQNIGGELAKALGLDVTFVNVKAKTVEGLGSIGAGDAIAAQVIATVSCEVER